MVFSTTKKKKKMLQKLVGVMIIENISSNFRRVVRSSVAHEFNAARSMALHYFRLRYADVLLMCVTEGNNYWDIRARG